jgi:hypothetical protein
LYKFILSPFSSIHLLIEPNQELPLNLLYPLDLLNYCNNGQKVEEYSDSFKKGSVERAGTYISTKNDSR